MITYFTMQLGGESKLGYMKFGHRRFSATWPEPATLTKDGIFSTIYIMTAIVYT